jgi:hypothetical protein
VAAGLIGPRRRHRPQRCPQAQRPARGPRPSDAPDGFTVADLAAKVRSLTGAGLHRASSLTLARKRPAAGGCKHRRNADSATTNTGAGEHEPSMATLARLSRALDVSLAVDIAPQSVCSSPCATACRAGPATNARTAASHRLLPRRGPDRAAPSSRRRRAGQQVRSARSYYEQLTNTI